MKRQIVVVLAVAAAVALPASSATAKSIGSCPTQGDYELTAVAELGITEEQALGIASLDGNGDGYTCIKPAPVPSQSVFYGGFLFRDNTVAR